MDIGNLVGAQNMNNTICSTEGIATKLFQNVQKAVTS